MIFRTVHLPPLYHYGVGDDANAELHYSACLRVLQDTLENGVILLDSEVEQSVIYSEIDARIAEWPQSFRERAQDLLKQLKIRKRLVPTSSEPRGNGEAIVTGCQHALAIAEEVQPQAVITPSQCPCHVGCGRSGMSLTPLGGYAISPYEESRANGKDVEPSQQRTRLEFEAEIWMPLFRDAQQVTIVDRVIGHKLDKRPDCKVYAEAGKDFARGVGWVFSQFLEHSRPDRDRSFTIVCELKTLERWERNPQTGKTKPRYWSREILARWHRVLQEFARQLERESGAVCPINMEVYRQKNRSHRMAHPRYLITDQVALLVDSGFDLLDERGNVREVQINHVRDYDAIVPRYRRLERAPSVNMSDLAFR